MWKPAGREVTRQLAEEIRQAHLTTNRTYRQIGAAYDVPHYMVRIIAKGWWRRSTYWDRTSIDQPYWPPSEEYQRVNGKLGE